MEQLVIYRSIRDVDIFPQISTYFYFSFLYREILPLPRGVLDMFKEGEQNEDFLLVL